MRRWGPDYPGTWAQYREELLAQIRNSDIYKIGGARLEGEFADLKNWRPSNEDGFWSQAEICEGDG